MFKKLALLLCAVALLLLVACKQDATAPGDKNSTAASSDQTSVGDNQITSSGIELEEDVFDENPVTNNSGTENTSSTITSDETVSNNNSSDNNTSSNTSSDESQNSSNEENDVVVDDDGTIRLPIDKFN